MAAAVIDTSKRDRAGFWRRLAGIWIDSLIVYSGTSGLIASLEWAGFRISIEPLFAVLAAVYGTLLIGWKGQTFGKMLLGLQVATAKGSSISYRAALIREVVGKWILAVVLPIAVGRIIVGRAWIPTVFDLLVLIPVLFVLLVHYAIRKRTWYDSLSRTSVVRLPAFERKRATTGLVVVMCATALGGGVTAASLSLNGWVPARLALYRNSRSLSPYIAFLQRPHAAPVDYVMQLFARYDIVVLCERLHPEATQWDFIYEVVSDQRFIDRVGHIFTEYGQVDEQPYLDRFMATSGLSATQVDERAVHILRNMNLWPVWDNTNFYTYLKRLYHLNQSLPESRRIQHYLSDLELHWEGLTENGYRAFRRTLAHRDRLMAERIIEKFTEIEASDRKRKKCLVIMNYRHAFNLVRVPETDPMHNTCEFLYQAFPGRTANVLLNTNILVAPIQGGIWDAAFEAVQNRPMGFDLSGSPFGRDSFDLFPFVPWTKGSHRYEDVFTGLVFAHPLSEQYIEHGIPGYFDGFEEEALRRARLLGKEFREDIEKYIASYDAGAGRTKDGLPHRRIQTLLELAMLCVGSVGLLIAIGAWFGLSRTEIL